MRLKNKTAIVTGAASGIGYAISETFAREGANVAMVGRSTEKLLISKDKIENEGESKGKIITLIYDISEYDNWQEIIRTTLAHFGSVDILINNAGISPRAQGAYLDSFEQGDFNNIFQTNYYGAVYSMNQALPIMEANGGGSIINIASFNAIRPTGNTAYSAAKAALVNTSQQQALYWARKNIRINCISPGMIDTPLNEGMSSNPEHRRTKELGNKSLLRTWGKAQSVANAALFLASDESDFITGVNLPVDGGYLLN